MNQNMLLFIQIQILPPGMHCKWEESIDIIGKKTNGNHRIPTPDMKLH
jgi:hypothetical protein